MRQPVRSLVHLEVGGEIQLRRRGRCAPPACRRARAAAASAPAACGAWPGNGRAGDVEVEAHEVRPRRRTCAARTHCRRAGAFSPGRAHPLGDALDEVGGQLRQLAAATAGGRASAFSWRQLARLARCGAPQIAGLAGILPRGRSRTRCSRGSTFQTRWWVAVAQRAPLGAGAGRGQRLEADLLEHGGGRRRRRPSRRPSDPPSSGRGSSSAAGPRARFTSVGAMSTWPTGAVTRRGPQPGHARDERHLGLGGVQVVAVGRDAVFAQALAVIAGDEDGGLVVEAQLLQGGDHPADVAVGEPDLAVVEIGLGRRRSRARSGWRS